MNILIIRPTPTKMNLKTYNLQEIGLAKALVRKGHQCDVMYYCGRNTDHWELIEFEGNRYVKILWIYGIGILREGIYPTLRKYINDYDIIQVGSDEGLTSCWLNRIVQEKVINYQGSYFYPENKGDIARAKIWDRTLLPLSRKENMIVATKSLLATEYIQNKGIHNVTTIGVGLDTDNLLAESNDEVYKHEFIQEVQQKKENNKYLLYIGVLEKRRNILFLLEVFSRVNKEIENTYLIIVGKGQEEYVKLCVDVMKSLEIQDKIIYREQLEQKHIKDLYEISDIFILPSRYEIFGMVLLEAMYFGLPVVTTYNGGSSTLMDGDNGIVLKDFDLKIWTETIVRLLKDEKLREKYGHNAANTIKQHYTWDALADKFLELYRQRLKQV